MKTTCASLTRMARQTGRDVLARAATVVRRCPSLCAWFGYGLTVVCDDHTFCVHLPDVERDAAQAAILRSGALPAYEDLLRLRRRTRPEMHILEIGSGNGVRAAYLARSLAAKSLRAVAFTDADLALTRKNVVLNDGGDILTTCLASAGDPCTVIVGAPADLVSLTADTPPELLDALRPMLSVVGPAVVVWETGSTGSTEVCAALLNACGYSAPECWDHAQFWMPRV